jgi:hypothetical protein
MLESFYLSWSLLPVLGFTIGLLVSMLGGGGGFFYVPALTLLYNLSTQLAVSTSLASIIPTTAIASLSHKRSGNLEWNATGNRRFIHLRISCNGCCWNIRICAPLQLHIKPDLAYRIGAVR